MPSAGGPSIPLPLKLAHTALVAVVVPFYAVHHGWRNFLWFSDVALLGMLYALWREHRLAASMLAVATLAFETTWLLDFLLALVLGFAPLRITAYMFRDEMPLFLRALSLFHVMLAPVMIWTVHRLRYDPRAWRIASLGSAVLLLATFLLTGPEDNINWVYGPGRAQALLPAPVYLILFAAALSFLVFRPTHWLLVRFFSGPARSGSRMTEGAGE